MVMRENFIVGERVDEAGGGEGTMGRNKEDDSTTTARETCRWDLAANRRRAPERRLPTAPSVFGTTKHRFQSLQVCRLRNSNSEDV